MKWIVFIVLSLTFSSLTISRARAQGVSLDSAQAAFYLSSFYELQDVKKQLHNRDLRESELLGAIEKKQSIINVYKRDSVALRETAQALQKKMKLSLDSAAVINKQLHKENRNLKIGGSAIIAGLLTLLILL